jgi:glutaredoxin 3
MEKPCRELIQQLAFFYGIYYILNILRRQYMSITIYTTPSCGFCNLAKAYFRERRLSFTEHDVSRDYGKAEEMVRKSGQMGVPVIDINGKIIVGFDKSRIDSALN